MPRDISYVSPNDPLFVEDPTSSQIKQPDGSYVDMVGSVMSKWAADFNAPGSNLDPADWDTSRNTGGMTVSTASGALNIATGLTAGAEVLLLGRVLTTVPINMQFVFSRTNVTLATTDAVIRVGYVEVDPVTLQPIPHANVPTDFRNRVNFGQGRVGSADSVSTWTLETLCNSGPVKQSAASIISASAAVDAALEVRADDVIASARAADSSAAQSGTTLRLSSAVPNPNKVYRPFIWVVNGSAPTQSITYTFSRVLSLDIQEMTVEVGGGRGNVSPAQAVPVQLTNGVTISAATMGSGTNGGSVHNRTSTAGTNGVNVKSSGGRISSGAITNLSASWVYVKFYNKASTPTVGTDSVVFTLPVRPGDQVQLAAIFDMYGMYFSTGIGYGITGGVAGTDTTAIAANDVHVGFHYA